MCHQNSAVFALSRHENHSVLQKTFGISDWYHASGEWEFPMGLIQPLNRTSALQLEAQPPGIDGPRVDGNWAEYLATHSLEFWLTSEDLPARDNRVQIDRDGDQSRQATAASNAQAMQSAVTQFRYDRSAQQLLYGLLFTLIGTIALVGFLALVQ